jgi:hypothetical protein
MKKIKLDVDALRVDSFATSAPAASVGTVQGHMPPPTLWTCPEAGCEPDTTTSGTGGGDTVDVSCGGGCYLSADGGNAFTCAVNCFSHYTDCHRCV